MYERQVCKMVFSIDEIKARISPIAKKYRLNAVYIFGSYAREEATENSDIDILIDRQGSTIRGMFDMGGLYNELSQSLGKSIDLVTLQTLKQKSTILRTPYFIENVEAEGIKIYE